MFCHYNEVHHNHRHLPTLEKIMWVPQVGCSHLKEENELKVLKWDNNNITCRKPNCIK